MSKITFRADDDLVERLEDLDTSKSEAMREALRAYLDGADRDAGVATAPGGHGADAGGSVDGVIRERVDELVADRLDTLLDERVAPVGRPRDLNLNVTLDGVNAAEPREDGNTTVDARDGDGRKTPAGSVPSDAGGGAVADACDKCGEPVEDDHVYCPNCGEKAAHRVFCECGDEVRSDWAFCPGCGRRTSAADVLERS
jgi:predicted transcriptional regulator/RNA polymerase subunit RPABC4/transcription elongation factor Spt4